MFSSVISKSTYKSSSKFSIPKSLSLTAPPTKYTWEPSFLIIFIDFTKLTRSLLVDQQITKNQFIFVALYISFGNSLLEEFIFRLISFIKLKEYCDKKTAYLFSAFMFSIYHAAMIGMSFPFLLTLFCLIGLFVLGIILDYLDEKDNNIYNSWFVHMFCDFAIMIVGFIHL